MKGEIMEINDLINNTSVQKFFGITNIAEISNETMELIRLLEYCKFDKGENMVSCGADAEDGMYIIINGNATVLSQNNKVIGKMHSGGFVGEMALISGKKRSATVRADDELQAVRISRPLFNDVVKKNPECYTVFMETLYANLTNVISEQQRIKAELDVASQIQESSLPKKFNNIGIEICATMHPAKEVGGDFYDIFNIDDKHVCVLVADVSGKGISASLFMLMAKMVIKNYAKLNIPVNEVFERANNELYENNEANMFVTSFMGILNTENGEFRYVNAGHNLPIILKGESKPEFIQAKPGFVLAGMENIKYKECEIKLDKNDAIFMYTDGVTEAQNKNDELFSDERLLKLFENRNYKEMPVKDVLVDIQNEITKYSLGIEQSDDITMLMFRIS